MKKYDVTVKIVSTSEFEVKAENEDKAIDMAEEVVLKTKFLLLNLDKRKIEIEAIELDSKSECNNCEYYCKDCDSCNYNEV